MDNTDIGDQVYLVSLLLVNGLAFVLICACYLKIYCTISGHNTIASRTDTTVAKRMALLVFTDFACWAPIAFFGLTAVAGHPLIDVTGSKVTITHSYISSRLLLPAGEIARFTSKVGSGVLKNTNFLKLVVKLIE